jgi:excisionase family DNA binding protein
MNYEELMTVTEAAEFLGVSPGTLYHWVSELKIPVIRFSKRCIRFRRSDIESWLERQFVPATDKRIPLPRKEVRGHTNREAGTRMDSHDYTEGCD